MSFTYWVFEDKDCFVFPHNAGWVGVSEDPRDRWHCVRASKKAPKARLVILYEDTREECLRREYYGQVPASAGTLHAAEKHQNRESTVDEMIDLQKEDQ